MKCLFIKNINNLIIFKNLTINHLLNPILSNLDERTSIFKQIFYQI